MHMCVCVSGSREDFCTSLTKTFLYKHLKNLKFSNIQNKYNCLCSTYKQPVGHELTQTKSMYFQSNSSTIHSLKFFVMWLIFKDLFSTYWSAKHIKLCKLNVPNTILSPKLYQRIWVRVKPTVTLSKVTDTNDFI